jgi:hypothetical protein
MECAAVALQYTGAVAAATDLNILKLRSVIVAVAMGNLEKRMLPYT